MRLDSRVPLGGISVIITTFNDGAYLSAAINSIENQTHRPDEVLVVDDGSCDCDIEKIFDSIKTSLVIRLYKKENNGGASEARNYGLAEASGEYVAFLDVDDSWLEDNLAYKFDKIKDRPKNICGFYGGYVSKPDGSGSNFKAYNVQVPPDDIGKTNGFPGGVPMYLFRRIPLIEIGGFDTNLKQNEDFDLVLRLMKAGYNVAGDNFVGYVRNLRKGSLTRGADHKLAYQNVSDFLDKAEAEKYFSNKELMNRRSLNALSCWKKCFFDFEDISYQKYLLDEFYENSVISSIKYFPIKMYRYLLAAIL